MVRNGANIEIIPATSIMIPKNVHRKSTRATPRKKSTMPRSLVGRLMGLKKSSDLENPIKNGKPTKKRMLPAMGGRNSARHSSTSTTQQDSPHAPIAMSPASKKKSTPRTRKSSPREMRRIPIFWLSVTWNILGNERLGQRDVNAAEE